MRTLPATALAVALAACGLDAAAQQPPPAFAPANLSPAGVRGLAANCAACHGTDGHTAPGSPITPLAGRPKEDIVQLMSQFKNGQKPATLMHQIAKGYSEAEIEALAAYFAAQKR